MHTNEWGQANNNEWGQANNDIPWGGKEMPMDLIRRVVRGYKPSL
jgi:hypothetical protein